jgi:vesicle-fusing ATPase
MPPDRMHMTSMEIAHSKTSTEIATIVARIQPSIAAIAHHTVHHPPRLVKPLLGFDSSAIALTYLPANGEALPGLGGRRGRGLAAQTAQHDSYTYHHFRRDLFDACRGAGAQVESRYVACSAHLSMARFVSEKGFRKGGGSGDIDREEMRRLVAVIEDINEWLVEEYWPKEGEATIKAGGEWIVGQEAGLDCRHGQLWYGGGETIYMGSGF